MKNILFVCVENSCRSQIAEAFARLHGSDKINAFSAGSKPSSRVNPKAIEVLKEKNIDISNAESKGFNDLREENFDYVISMGCKDVCPFIPADQHIEWQIQDPKDHEIDFSRQIRDTIEEHVSEFIKGL